MLNCVYSVLAHCGFVFSFVDYSIRRLKTFADGAVLEIVFILLVMFLFHSIASELQIVVTFGRDSVMLL